MMTSGSHAPLLMIYSLTEQLGNTYSIKCLSALHPKERVRRSDGHERLSFPTLLTVCTFSISAQKLSEVIHKAVLSEVWAAHNSALSQELAGPIGLLTEFVTKA